MNILIINNASSTDKGDAILLEGLIIQLKKVFRRPRIVVLSTHTSFFKHTHTFPVHYSLLDTTNGRKLDYFVHAFNICRLSIWSLWFHFTGKSEYRLLGSKYRPAMKQYQKADLIISVGGSYIHDLYKPAILGRLIEFFFASCVLKKQVVLWSQSIGPFKTSVYRLLASFTLNQVDIIATRDYTSLKTLKKLGVNKPLIFQTYDSAFGFGQMRFKKKYIDSLLKKERITKKKKISISVRKWHYYSTSAENNHESYINNLVRASDYLIERYHVEIYFLSTSISALGLGDDDRSVAETIAARMKHSHHTHIIKKDYTPIELIALYSTMDLHIGTRMHSTIFSMLAGTPALHISYEFKGKDLYNMLGLKAYLLNIETFTYDELIQKIIRIMKNKRQVKKIISKKIPEFQKKIVKDSLVLKNEK